MLQAGIAEGGKGTDLYFILSEWHPRANYHQRDADGIEHNLLKL